MRGRLFIALLLACLVPLGGGEKSASATIKPLVYVLPIRENIMPPLVYLVRRGVKEAMAAKAGVLIIDMHTKGGRVDTCIEIVELIDKFPGRTVTFVNNEAYSAGAFISFATSEIYMAPRAVIGAAAPILMSPGGAGTQDMPNTLEAKMTSAISAKIRAYAEKHGHDTRVVQAMVDKTTELEIDGEVINKEGNILTLTDREAAKEYGDPRKPLLSSGTEEDIDALIDRLGYTGARVVRVEPTGMERLGTWINTISPILLLLGIVGLYIEVKTPGFGVPGIVGVLAFLVYFFGGYVSGLTGMEWVVLFALGLGLLVLEVLVWPGAMVFGLTGGLMILLSLLMGMVDRWPGGPAVPEWPQLQAPLLDLFIAVLGAVMVGALLGRWLPRSALYGKIAPASASGMEVVAETVAAQSSRLGQTGVTESPLHPGGKALFGQELLDVKSEGEPIESGARVKIIGHSGRVAVVREV